MASAYFACCGCSWEGSWAEAMDGHEGLLCPECGEEIDYTGHHGFGAKACRIEEGEEFVELGHLCLACGNTDERLFEAGKCLNCITNKIYRR